MRRNPKAKRWLAEGKRRFANEGIKGININEMAKSIGVAKSSFYFMFKNQQVYWKELLKYWEIEGTYQITERVSVIDDPKAKFRKLMELALDNNENDRFLFMLRPYAQVNPEAKRVLSRIENFREGFLFKILPVVLIICSPSNGLFPVNISYKTIPNEN